MKSDSIKYSILIQTLLLNLNPLDHISQINEPGQFTWMHSVHARVRVCWSTAYGVCSPSLILTLESSYQSFAGISPTVHVQTLRPSLSETLDLRFPLTFPLPHISTEEKKNSDSSCIIKNMHSDTIQLNPPTLWVESSCTRKHRKTEPILSCSPEVVTSFS